uniref:Geranylgeranyl diphosphate synthase n=1 Tax=Nigrospora sphaerica TaxID=114231 RepID=Q9P965_9PEZI|nr:geranylgeranyl diphosphate synthase [Nigrospora sphaerica]
MASELACPARVPPDPTTLVEGKDRLSHPAVFHFSNDFAGASLSTPRTPQGADPDVLAADEAADEPTDGTDALPSRAYTTSPSLCSGQERIEVDFDHWTEAKEKVVTGPYDYIAASPGKEIRSLMLACFNAWLEVPAQRLEVIKRAVGMLHTASLLIDDIQDNSELRRGRPVAHKIFGPAMTINSANHMYFLALQELNALETPGVVDIFTDELLRLHRGQAMDLYWRETLTCPTEADYFEMTSNKTGGLFRLAYRLMKAESAVSVDLMPVVELLGVLFQVADDYKNLCSREYGDLKGVGEDLTEGKFSFPIIHTIRTNPADLQLLNILRERPTNDHVKRYAIELMEKTGSFRYTRGVLKKLATQVHEAVHLMDQGRGKGKALFELMDRITGFL